jgi:hypothetical protein
MKILSWILLTVGLILVTILTTSTIEHFFPDSINWIMVEVDWWYAKIWGWAVFTLFALVALFVVGCIIFKGVPLLVPLFRKCWPYIVKGVEEITSNPKGKKILLSVARILIVATVLTVVIVGIVAGFWILSLMP